ncbi:UPF0725 protein At1g23970-like [Brassica napus]|uniref:UPF0725 protein At1g23970-like n=1 Tax=Brassica napus TaxID=3708 RepID=UPI0006AB73EB|nr:UPF0725 protein At1g23970-like [Brassica napus]
MTTEDNVPEEYVSAEEYARVRDDYWRVVRESEGFDLEDVSIPPYMCGTPICGTNYQLSSLIKFNVTMNCVSSYYLTLLAHDPDVSPTVKTFQVRIDEKSFGRLDFTCSVARLKEEAKDEETSADDSEPSKERLKGKSAHVYITFKGLDEPQAPRQSFEFGEHVERRAIVRRVICEST